MRGLYRVPEAALIPARKWIKSGKHSQESKRIVLISREAGFVALVNVASNDALIMMK